MAIKNIGEIIINYDYDKKITALGFGGICHFPNFKHKFT